MTKNLVIMGAGGHGSEGAWTAEEMNKAQRGEPLWNIIGYVDDDTAKIGKELYGYRVLGTPEDFAGTATAKKIWYYCAMGDNRAREKVVARLDGLGWHAATLVHPAAIVAKDVVIGDGSYVGPLCNLSPNSRIGRHVLINSQSTVGHDVEVGDFAQICPGARVNGFCVVGRFALVGSNASIFQGRKIADDVRVGSNSFIVQNVTKAQTMIGVPARPLPTLK
jgi:sugar O-acyltransferase (sialic acid O-acetyltransferase NeuD family)